MYGYTIPHIKTFTVYFRSTNDKGNESLNHKKNIFLFGSHNLTQNAWWCNGKYKYN
jgi:hypothetical protein